MKWMQADPEHELIEAVSRYLEIVEEGGDGAAYLRTLGPLAPSVREIVGIGDALRIDIPGPTPGEIARGRRELYEAITATGRRRAAASPKLFGVIAAAGLGLGLGAAFASGAVPSRPFSAVIETIPFVGVDATPGNGRNGGGHPIAGSGGPTENSNVAPVSSPTSEAGELIQQGQPDLPPTPASENGRGIGATGTPPGQGGENPGNGGGVGSGGTPPGQGGENPGNGNGVGSGGTPPGQGGENPGNAGGNGGGIGSGGTPPGQGGDNPGQGSGGGVGGGGTPPGQGGDNPGQGSGGGDGNNGNGNGNGGGDGSAGGGNGNGNSGNGNGNGGGDGSAGGGNGNGNNGNGNGNGGGN